MSNEQKEELRRLWKERVDAFKESGQSARTWCSENNLKEHQLWYWVKKYDTKNERPHSKWVSVDIPPKTTILHDSVLTVKVNQISIEIKPGFDPELLRDVVQVLNKSC